MWNFSPGSQTVLQYYLSNTLHASDTQWGAFNAIASIFAVPTYVFVISMVVLIGLGVWQVQRLSWKEGLIDQADAAAVLVDDRNGTLVVLGGNPVFDAPADLDFAAANDQLVQLG